MNPSTRLEPLTADSARELLELLRTAGEDDGIALALDGEGRVLGVVGASDYCAECVPGDRDVRA